MVARNEKARRGKAGLLSSLATSATRVMDIAALALADAENQRKHAVSFEFAQYAFADPDRVIAEDMSHSQDEQRYFCFGRIGDGILTVRFTYRQDVIRIFGAGHWRKGKRVYEQENHIH